MSSSASGSGDVFDIRRVRRLVELMKEHDLNEIDLRQGEQRIRLRRDEEMVMAPAASAAPPPAAPPPAAAAPPRVEIPTAEEQDVAYVTSPMVGTFYTAASPDAEPYLKVGDAVGKETTVCIIEAMKVFNEIPAEVAGQIIAVLAENGDPVEFGQRLFKVKV